MCIKYGANQMRSDTYTNADCFSYKYEYMCIDYGANQMRLLSDMDISSDIE
jgi:hypothetical protein